MDDNHVICRSCINHKHCKGLCAPLQWINGHIPGREPLASDIKGLPAETSRNYNTVISEIIEDRRARLHNITDTRRRAITALLLADISRHDVSILLKMSYRHISRIINNNT